MNGPLSFIFILTIVASLSISGLWFQTVVAQVMTSGSYQIQSDSINIGGGNATSTNYELESTTGELASGNGASTNYQLFAGYQQMQEVYLSLSPVADVVLSPALPGISGGTATGSTAVHVTTDSRAGYQITIVAENAPAMQDGAETIADYSPAGVDPDFVFTTSASDAHFGFSPEGSDIAVRYQDSGGVCGVSGGDTSERCWDGLSTSARVITLGSTSNHPLGATTTVLFRLDLGGGIVVAPGTYVATTTITALPL